MSNKEEEEEMPEEEVDVILTIELENLIEKLLDFELTSKTEYSLGYPPLVLLDIFILYTPAIDFN